MQPKPPIEHLLSPREQWDREEDERDMWGTASNDDTIVAMWSAWLGVRDVSKSRALLNKVYPGLNIK